MITTILNSNKDLGLGDNQKIDELLLDFYSAMPSQGTYPFTMLRISNPEPSDLMLAPVLASHSHILILERTDFSLDDLIDYVSQTKEHSDLRSEAQFDFLRNYRLRYQDQADLITWKNRITSLGIGIIMQLAKQKGLHLIMKHQDLSKSDFLSGYTSPGLQVYQLLTVA